MPCFFHSFYFLPGVGCNIKIKFFILIIGSNDSDNLLHSHTGLPFTPTIQTFTIRPYHFISKIYVMLIFDFKGFLGNIFLIYKIRCSQVSLFSVVCYTYLNIIGSVLLFLMGVNLRFKCCHNFCRIFVELFTAKVPHLCGLCGNTITTKICHFVPPMGIEPIFSV